MLAEYHTHNVGLSNKIIFTNCNILVKLSNPVVACYPSDQVSITIDQVVASCSSDQMIITLDPFVNCYSNDQVVIKLDPVVTCYSSFCILFAILNFHHDLK